MYNLSNSTLANLPRTVKKPSYDRKSVQAGILHIGVGNFHRAHQAVYTDNVLNAGDHRWGITGISLRRADIRDALSKQDGLYGLGVKGNGGTEWRVIGAVQKIVFASENQRAVMEDMASPLTRIISLTVTEKAYCLKSQTGTLDETHPDILHDLQHRDEPRSIYGYLTGGLALRISRNFPLPALLSCDNLAANGQRLRQALIRFASLQNSELAKRLTDDLACPSSMVDRIVPQTTDLDRAEAQAALGLTDAWPVITEPFSQWVIEDDFPLGRPDWDQKGAEFVRDALPYERMKLSLLNASHSALAFLGLVAGYRTVAEAMNEPALEKFIAHLMRDDIAPVLNLPSEINVERYITSLLTRFQNLSLEHHLIQIASDSSQKIPQRFMRTIRERLNRGLPLARFAFALAGFLLLLEQSMEDTAFAFQDPKRDLLIGSLRQAGQDDADKVSVLLADATIFGNIRDHRDAMFEVLHALSELRRHGIKSVLGRF